MQDQSSNSAQMIKAQYVMRRSASPAPGVVANLARDQVSDDSSHVCSRQQGMTHPPSASWHAPTIRASAARSSSAKSSLRTASARSAQYVMIRCGAAARGWDCCCYFPAKRETRVVRGRSSARGAYARHVSKGEIRRKKELWSIRCIVLGARWVEDGEEAYLGCTIAAALQAAAHERARKKSTL